MTVNQIAERLSLKPISLPDGERTVSGGYVGDLLSWVMGRVGSDHAWITIMSNINIVAVASLADVACILLAEGVEPDEMVKQTAVQKGINVLTSDMTAYELAVALSGLLR